MFVDLRLSRKGSLLNVGLHVRYISVVAEAVSVQKGMQLTKVHWMNH
jgi:hypothetical protein